MWLFLIGLLSFVLECIKIYLVYHKVIGVELVKYKVLRTIIVASVFGCAVISSIEINQYSVFWNTAMLFFLSLVLFKGNILKKCVMFFALYSLVCLLDMWFNSMQEILVQTKELSFLTKKLIELLVSGITISILWLLGKVKMKYLRVQLSRRLIWYQGMILAGVIIISCIFMGYSQVVLQDSGSLLNRILNFIFVCAWMALVLMVIILIYNIIVKEHYKLLIEVNEKLLLSQQQYYRIVLEKDESIRRFRHDYKSHMGSIRMYAKLEDYHGILSYIEELERTTSEFAIDINTGNMIVNAILNDTIQKFSEYGISIEVQGVLPEQLRVRSMDITTIFSNAILNAVEATAKCKYEDRKVKVLLKCIKNKYIIEMKNPIEEPLEIEDGLIQTTKNDKMNHGFGITNIKNCLEKYNGLLEFERKDNYIYTRIII